MIDVRSLEQCPDEYRKYLQWRNDDPSLVDKILEASRVRREKISQAEDKKAEQNAVTKKIAEMKKNKEDASSLIADMKALGAEIKSLQSEAEEADLNLKEILLRIPNKLHESVVQGKGEEDNLVVKSVGEAKNLAFAAKTHDELGEKLGILDFERASKIAGARFSILQREGALLERALIQFMLDLHTQQHGYEECIPPFIVNETALLGTGQFPKFKEDVFHLEGFPYYLIPTAEVPVTNFYAGEILDSAELPKSFAAYTPCFRSEAGSYGRDTKGLIRQHQFQKVELVHFVRPEESYKTHEQLLSHAEEVLKQLEIAYQVVSLCSGDIGFSAAKCYDINVWLPGQNAYREISSCSNFEDFQARRANIRFREKKEKPQFVHTLNGSGLAVGRCLVAVLENYQQEDGSVIIPKVLQPYMKGKEIISI